MNQPSPEEPLTPFELDLMDALRPVDPPAGFADRVIARTRVAAPAPARMYVLPVRRAWIGGAIAAALLVGAILGQQVQARHHRQQADFAERQFEAGLRITDNTLEHARQQLRQAGVLEGD